MYCKEIEPGSAISLSYEKLALRFVLLPLQIICTLVRNTSCHLVSSLEMFA